MNANELADALDDVVANYIQMIADVDFSDVATMLRQQEVEIERITSKYEEMIRQQQDEIEALKERLEDTNSGWLNATKTACTAQAEIKSLKAQISSLKRKVNNEYIRAELALANKKLTDKEITEIYFDDPDILVFARAILKKAQE